MDKELFLTLLPIKTEEIQLVLTKKGEQPLTPEQIEQKKELIGKVKKILSSHPVGKIREILLEQVGARIVMKAFKEMTDDQLKLVLQQKDKVKLTEKQIDEKRKLIYKVKELQTSLKRDGHLIGRIRETLEAILEIRRELPIQDEQVAEAAEAVAEEDRSEDVYSTCVNDDDMISLEPIRDVIDKEDLIQIPSPPEKGFCYNISDLVYLLKSSKKNSNPFTTEKIWRGREEFDLILDHAQVSPGDRIFLERLFFPKGVPAEITAKISGEPELVDLIGTVGHILANDYTEDYGPSIEALGFLAEKLDGSPLLKIDYPLKRSLKEILKQSESDCIHLIGNYLILFYLYYYYEVLQYWEHPLISNVIQLKEVPQAFVYLVNTGKRDMVILYIHPDQKEKFMTEIYQVNKYYLKDRLEPYPYTRADTYLQACQKKGHNPLNAKNRLVVSEESLYPFYKVWQKIFLETDQRRDELRKGQSLIQSLDLKHL